MQRFANLIFEVRDQDDLGGVFVSVIDGQRFTYSLNGTERSRARSACLARVTYLAEGLLSRYGAINLGEVECRNGRLHFVNPNVELLQRRYQNDPF